MKVHAVNLDAERRRALLTTDAQSAGETLTIRLDDSDGALDPITTTTVTATGTPEPGGGDWYRTLRFLRRVFAERDVIACDVVELAPVPGVHAPDFLVAKLVYKLIGYRFDGPATAGE